MDVSVIVVTQGGSAVLEDCIRAIAAGTARPREIVLVDQAPPRQRAPLSDWLAGAEIQARHIHSAPIGVSQARNLGAASAGGDHLAFTDDDCVPDRDWLRALSAAPLSSEVEAATGRVLPLATDTPGLVPVSSRLETTRRVFDVENGDVPWDSGTGGNLLVRRARFAELGGFDTDFGPGGRFRAAEDIELLERLLGAGARIGFEPDAVVHHEMKPSAGRWRRRFPYGFGMGALVVRARRERRGLLARRYLAMQLRTIASGVRRLSARRALESLISCAGFAVGLAAGLSRRGRRREPRTARPSARR